MTSNLFRFSTVSVAVAAACAALAVWSSGSQASVSHKPSSAASKVSAKLLVPEPATSPPTIISQTVPLTKKPPKGKTIGYVNAGLPLEAFYVKEGQVAAAKLGWKFESFVNANPAVAAAAAIAAHVNYIYTQDYPPQTMTPEIELAHKDGIPFVNAASPGSSHPSEAQGYYDVDPNPAPYGTELGRWMVNNSNGKANTAMFALEGVSYFDIIEHAEYTVFTDHCPACKIAKVPVSDAAFAGGQVPSEVVAYLQTHPSVTYVALSYGDMYPGVEQALKAAGLASKVTIVGVDATSTILKDMASGVKEAWVETPSAEFIWSAVDLFARMSVGDSLSNLNKAIADDNGLGAGGADAWVLATKADAVKYQQYLYAWPGPVGYQSDWAKLWHVG